MNKWHYLASVTIGLLLGLGFWLTQFNAETPETAFGKPNLIFLSFCSMRSEEVGIISGEHPSITPHVDKFFEKGFVFKNAFTSYGWTNMSSYLFEDFDINYLTKNGYEYVFSPESPLLFWVPAPFFINKKPTLLIEQYTNQYKEYYAELKNRLLLKRGHPFFAFIHTKYLHYPYIDTINSESGWDIYLSETEKEYINQLIKYPQKYPDSLPTALLLNGSIEILEHFAKLKSQLKSPVMKFFDQYKLFSNLAIMKKWESSTNYKKDLGIIHKVYRAKLHYLDHQINDLINLYGNQELLENSVVILTGDHGESLMEHDILGHAANIHDEIMRFPLLIKFPRSNLTEKIVINEQIYQGSFKKIMQGLVEGQINQNNFHQKITELESNKEIIMRNCENTIQGIRAENQWKYIKNYKTGDQYLFNLMNDPKEKNNIIESKHNIAAQLELHLILNREKIGKINDHTPCQGSAGDNL